MHRTVSILRRGGRAAIVENENADPRHLHCFLLLQEVAFDGK